MKRYDTPITAELVNITTLGTNKQKDKECTRRRRYVAQIKATLELHGFYDNAHFIAILDAAIRTALECKTTLSHALRATLAETRRLCEEAANR